MGGTTTACPPSAKSRTITAQCDPTLPTTRVPPAGQAGQAGDRLPRNFVELCECLTSVDEEAFEDLWRALGLSVDWDMTYTTIEERSRRVAQRAFLRNLARGEAYQAEAPVLWDVDFRSAVAQAELEDREMPGAYHRIPFHRADGRADRTTSRAAARLCRPGRPPRDERYQKLRLHRAAVRGRCGCTLIHWPTPKGRDAMTCTFGDLPTCLVARAHLRRGGRRRRPPVDPTPRSPTEGAAVYNDNWPANLDQAASSSCSPSRRARGAQAHHPPGQVLRKGEALEIITSRHGTCATVAATPTCAMLCSAGPRAALASAAHAGRYRLGQRARGDGWSAANGFGVPSRSGTH
jgi:hypothetical protein